MEIGQTETEKYKNLLDWLQNGSGHLPIACFLNDVTEHLPSTKRYFKILYLFCGHKPLDDEYVISHWEGIEKECRKSKDFDRFIKWYITQTCSSAESDVKVTLYSDDSIVVQYIGKEPPLPKYKIGDEVTVRGRYVSGDYYYFTGVVECFAWDDEAMQYDYTIKCSCIEKYCCEKQITSVKNKNL